MLPNPNNYLNVQQVKQKYFTPITQIDFDQKYGSNLELLGQGSQSNVFKSTKSSPPLVIKTYNSNHLTPTTIKYVVSQIESLRELHGHANIIKLIATYLIPDRFNKKNKDKLCLVLEYCDIDLKRFIIDYSPLYSNPEKCNICLQITEGVKYTHQKHRIHRDLKPENILLCIHQDQSSLKIINREIKSVKIIDFGCCHHLKSESSHSVDISILLSTVGTPIYQDPNVQTGKYTEKCDIYSLGLIICEIFCGENIFSKCQNQIQLNDIKDKLKDDFNGEINKYCQYLQSQKNINKDVCEFIEGIMKSTLSNDEDQRLSATELLNILYQAIQSFLLKQSQEESMVGMIEMEMNMQRDGMSQSRYQDAYQNESSKRDVFESVNFQEFSQIKSVGKNRHNVQEDDDDDEEEAHPYLMSFGDCKQDEKPNPKSESVPKDKIEQKSKCQTISQKNSQISKFYPQASIELSKLQQKGQQRQHQQSKTEWNGFREKPFKKIQSRIDHQKDSNDDQDLPKFNISNKYDCLDESELTSKSNIDMSISRINEPQKQKAFRKVQYQQKGRQGRIQSISQSQSQQTFKKQSNTINSTMNSSKLNENFSTSERHQKSSENSSSKYSHSEIQQGHHHHHQNNKSADHDPNNASSSSYDDNMFEKSTIPPSKIRQYNRKPINNTSLSHIELQEENPNYSEITSSSKVKSSVFGESALKVIEIEGGKGQFVDEQKKPIKQYGDFGLHESVKMNKTMSSVLPLISVEKNPPHQQHFDQSFDQIQKVSNPKTKPNFNSPINRINTERQSINSQNNTHHQSSSSKRIPLKKPQNNKYPPPPLSPSKRNSLIDLQNYNFNNMSRISTFSISSSYGSNSRIKIDPRKIILKEDKNLSQEDLMISKLLQKQSSQNTNKTQLQQILKIYQYLRQINKNYSKIKQIQNISHVVLPLEQKKSLLIIHSLFYLTLLQDVEKYIRGIRKYEETQTPYQVVKQLKLQIKFINNPYTPGGIAPQYKFIDDLIFDIKVIINSQMNEAVKKVHRGMKYFKPSLTPKLQQIISQLCPKRNSSQTQTDLDISQLTSYSQFMTDQLSVNDLKYEMQVFISSVVNYFYDNNDQMKTKILYKDAEVLTSYMNAFR